MADTSEDREFAAGHLAAAIEKRLYEIRDRDFLVGLPLDTNEPALSEAAWLALHRLLGLRFAVEKVTAWGQRVEPPVRSFIRQTKGLWVPVRLDGKDDGFAPFEPVGIYLGDGMVLVVPPEVKP